MTALELRKILDILPADAEMSLAGFDKNGDPIETTIDKVEARFHAGDVSILLS